MSTSPCSDRCSDPRGAESHTAAPKPGDTDPGPDSAGWSWADLHRNRTVYEDRRVLVLDKPEGISVTGERHGTDMVRLAAEVGVKLRPVHRIDKVTSGLVVLALEPGAHSDLTRQFTRRQVHKEYLAVLVGSDLPDRGEIDLPLVTASSGRVRIAAPRDAITWDGGARRYGVPVGAVDSTRRVFESTTTFEVRARDEDRDLVLVALGPRTGRRHQIRVHTAWVGHPVAGDPLFRTTSRPEVFGRAMLHAHRLGITLSWVSPEPVTFEAPPPAGFEFGT